MRPVHTKSSNLVYVGPSPEIGDLHCQRIREGMIRSVWWFTPDERRMIAEGANLSLLILSEPIPPVGLRITSEQGDGNDAPDVLARLESLKAEAKP